MHILVIWLIYNMPRIVVTHSSLKNNLNNKSKVFFVEKTTNCSHNVHF